MIKRSRYTKEELNSGQMEFGYENHIRENGKLIRSDFVVKGKLNFANKNLRESDYSIYEHLDRVTTKKVKTYYIEDVQRQYKVKINDEIYDITAIDPDADETYMYWYLERVKK